MTASVGFGDVAFRAFTFSILADVVSGSNGDFYGRIADYASRRFLSRSDMLAELVTPRLTGQQVTRVSAVDALPV